jgi:cation diffusion facilitator family transporter
MPVKSFQVKTTEITDKLPWHILRLLRKQEASREELFVKLDKLYLGYWQVDEELVDKMLLRLYVDGRILHNDAYSISDEGRESLRKHEQQIEHDVNKHLSKESCARYSLLGNVGLSALEYVIGFLSGSIGLIADATHTAVDIVASAITWIGIRLRREAQAGIAGGIILCIIGGFIVYESVSHLLVPVQIKFGGLALITIVVNIGVNWFFSMYKFYVGGRTRSIALVSDAYHTKTDIWSSVAVLIGLIGALAGFQRLDAIAGAVVSIFIVHGGYELISESIKVMHGEDPELERFSRFLKNHLEVLPESGAMLSLWLFSLYDMTKEENIAHLRGGFGRHFPVQLLDNDYEDILYRLKKDRLIEQSGDLYRLTDAGNEALSRMKRRETTYAGWLKLQPQFLSTRKLNWFIEGL